MPSTQPEMKDQAYMLAAKEGREKLFGEDIAETLETCVVLCMNSRPWG